MNWNWDELEEKKQKNANTVIKHGEKGSSWQSPDFGVGNNINDFLKKSKPLFYALVVAFLCIWLISGFYIVHPDELGVETRFGAYVATTEPGPHYHWPYPIGAVYKPKVTEVKRVEIGFAQSGSDAEMLTEDENIVNVQFSVQYQIKDPVQYIFKVAQQTELIQNASQAVMREVIGSNKIDSALTDGKQAIQTKAQDILQSITDEYELGVQIIAVQMQNVFPPKEVSEAFKDVASAREDKARFINEAEAYRNDIIPKARGEADAIVNRALAYKEALILKANAQAKQFELLLAEYKKSPATIKERLYIESMEEVLTKAKDKTLIPNKTAPNILPYLPLTSKGDKR